jgi:hypothetical protein
MQIISLATQWTHMWSFLQPTEKREDLGIEDNRVRIAILTTGTGTRGYRTRMVKV